MRQGAEVGVVDGEGAERWRPAAMVPVIGSLALFVAVVVLFVARLVVSTDGAGHLDGRPFDEFGLVIDPADPASTQLRSGMVVQAIDGVTIDDLLSDGPIAGGDVGEVHRYRVLAGHRVRDIDIELRPLRAGRVASTAGVLLPAGVVLLAIGIYVFARRPREESANALLAFGVAMFAIGFGAMYGMEPADLAFRPWLFALGRFVNEASFVTLLFSLSWFAITFPRPPPLLRRRSWLVSATYVALASMLLVEPALILTRQASLGTLRTLYDLSGVLLAPVLLVTVVSLVTNVRRARRDPEVRRDLMVVAGGLATTGVLFAGLNLVPDAVVAVPDSVFVFALLPLPLCVAYALLRRGLFDARAVVDRTIVYVVLTAGLVAGYTAGTAVLQSALRVSDLTASVPFTALLAVGFAPARDRVQHVVDRVMYGRRDEPYAVLAEVGRGLQASGQPAESLQRLVEAIADALRLPHVAVRLESGSADADAPGTTAAETGVPVGEPLRLPLVHQGVRLGLLEASPRSAGEPFGLADLRLLADIATQAAVASNALRLTDALARSRARAVTASQDERERIRRDLHDGLGPALAAVSLQLAAALDHLPGDAPAADFVRRADAAAATAKTEVRRIIDGMAPVQLDRFGLMAAVRSLGDQLNSDPAAGSPGHPVVGVEGPASLEAVAPEVEVGAYRIAAEAMLNACRHSGGRRCDVTVRVNCEALVVEVVDDGVGIPSDPKPGVGLRSIRERAAAMGGAVEVAVRATGGTCLTATLPVTGADEPGPR